MKKHIFPICTLATALCLSGAGLTSCSEPDDVQDMVLARVLSPTNVSARVSENVNLSRL